MMFDKRGKYTHWNAICQGKKYF